MGVQEEVKEVSDIVENESEFEPSPEDNTERVHTYNESLDIKEKETKLDSSVIEQSQDDSKLKDKEDIELIREETSKNNHEIDVVADGINTREITKEKEESMKIDVKEKLNESAENKLSEDETKEDTGNRSEIKETEGIICIESKKCERSTEIVMEKVKVINNDICLEEKDDDRLIGSNDV